MDNKDLEKELWEKIDPIMDFDNEKGIYEILLNIGDEEMVAQMEHDDLVLGLSGVDEDAIDRVDRRREYIKELNRIKEKIKTDKEEALKKFKERQRININNKGGK